MATSTSAHTEESVEVASGKIHFMKGGQGDSLLVLHDDVGSPGWLPFYATLAESFTVYVPSHPGFGSSDRPTWMRSVRDMAIVEQWMLTELGIEATHVVGLGFGGWIAAEMATMCQHRFNSMTLIGAAGIKPTEGEIADQFLLSGEEFAKLGFSNPERFAEIYGSEVSLDQQEAWEVNREMVARIAWEPYLFNQTLPYLLPSVKMPTLIVWGSEDKVVPLSCGKRYNDLLPNSRLEVIGGSGHSVSFEKPEELAALIKGFI
jgi:pimeloyl-ACP methyl ester carboxylesterase